MSQSNQTYQDCWQYLKKNSNKESSTCNICNKVLLCKGSATTGLRRHLEGVHGFKRKANASTSGCGSNSSQIKRYKSYKLYDDQTINKFVTRPTMSELISKLAAVDGFSFNRITKSEFIRQSMNAKGFNLPRNPTDVMKIMLGFYEQKKQELIQKINLLKSEKKKFTISIDEWTSINNKRYMNIHIYYNTTDSDNLGLVPIEGSCTAEKTLELVDKKLNSFDVSFKQDIVSVMSDGAAVMQKFGKLSPAYQQLCYNHGLHLAVLKVLYVQKNRKNTSTNFDRHRTDRTEEPLLDSHDDDTEECEDTEDEIQNENNYDSGDSDIETVETIDVCM